MEREKLRIALNKNFKSFDYLIKLSYRDFTKEDVFKSVQAFIDKYKAGEEKCKFVFVIKEIENGLLYIVRLVITNIIEIDEIEVENCLKSIEVIRKSNGHFDYLADYLLATDDYIGGYSEGFFGNE